MKEKNTDELPKGDMCECQKNFNKSCKIFQIIKEQF